MAEPLRFEGLDAAALVRLDEALRRGAPTALHLTDDLPHQLRVDQVAPWFDAATARSAPLQAALRAWLPPQARPLARRPRVSAIIPTHRHTPLGLGALRAQDCALEVVVLANGPARDRPLGGDRVLRVDWEGHGRTRQRGVEAADGDYVLLTVDDALPRGGGCVRRMVEALEEGGYDAVFARQVPWPGSDRVTRDRLARWTPAGTAHHTVDRLDDVFALYRRETLLRAPLPDVPTGEDLHWRQGRRVGYVPLAPVVHAHTRTPGELYRRTRDLHREHTRLGEAPRVPDLGALLRALPGVVEPTLQVGPGELVNQVAELLGQWRGGRK